MTKTSTLHIKTVRNKTPEELVRLYNSVSECKPLIRSVFNIPTQSLRNANILIKPNWVRHCKTHSDVVCLVTHDNFILASLEIILKGKPRRVVIGDA